MEILIFLIAAVSLCVSCFSLGACIGLRQRVRDLDSEVDVIHENHFYYMNSYEAVKRELKALSGRE